MFFSQLETTLAHSRSLLRPVRTSAAFRAAIILTVTMSLTMTMTLATNLGTFTRSSPTQPVLTRGRLLLDVRTNNLITIPAFSATVEAWATPSGTTRACRAFQGYMA
jgi:hypothetical protein